MSGRWMETCQCGRTTKVEGLRWIVTGGKEPCDGPHPHSGEERPSVANELGWCGCGDHDRVDDLMRRYLTSLTVPIPERATDWPDSDFLLAYLAASLDWTEHGSSIRYPWLTEEGEAVLRILSPLKPQEETARP